MYGLTFVSEPASSETLLVEEFQLGGRQGLD